MPELPLNKKVTKQYQKENKSIFFMSVDAKILNNIAKLSNACIKIIHGDHVIFVSAMRS